MSRDFDGSGNEFITYSLAASQTSLDTISIGSWLYLDSNSQYRRHFERGDTTIGAIDDTKWEFDDAWGFVFKSGWTTTAGAWSIAKPSTGAWFHALVTYDWGATTNDPVLYINGVAQALTERATPAGTKANSGTVLTIGANEGGGFSGIGSHDGRIAEFSMWNRILSAGEAAILGDSFSSLHIPRGLVFYPPLIGKIDTEPDIIKGTAGTISGTPATSAHPRIIYPTRSQIMRIASTAPSIMAQSAYKMLMGLGV